MRFANGLALMRSPEECDGAATGAVTGVHPIRAGQSATIEMAGMAPISCRASYAPLTRSQSNPA
jgi:hypothetical protein